MAQNWAKGKEGKVNFGEDICVTGWTMDVGGDDADVTGSCTAVKDDVEITDEYTGTFEGIWDKDAHPTDSPPNLLRGAIGTLKLYISTTLFIQIAARIKTFAIVSTVGDVIKWTVTWRGTAAPTWPV